MISPHAYIHPNASIAEDVTIEAFATIADNVIIGSGSWIGPHATIMEGTRIGSDSKVFPGAVVGGVPQDLKFKGEQTTLEIGDRVVVRECVTINRGTQANHRTVIGDDCLLMAYAHVAHDCILGSKVILANNVNLAGHIEVGDYAIFEGMAAVQQFVKVGCHSFIAGGSLVRKDVPPYVKAAREPLAFAGINSIGLRRRGFSSEKIKEIHDIYRILFIKGYSTTKATSLIEAQFPVSAERDVILSFINNSIRGIMKGFTSIYDNKSK